MYNLYPDGNNKPRFSFDVPTTPPDVDPDEGDTVGAFWNPAWTAPMLAALDQLILYATWNGTDEEKQLAVMRAANLKELLANAIPEQDPLPTPFWDEVTDTDDQTPAGELSPWYGTATVTYHSPPDVTFVEQLFIWGMAGFIAYAGQPGSAIAFLTIAPKFVLAFKTGNLGAVIDLIVDSAHIANVDTYSVEDGIKYVQVQADPDNETHQIYIVKDDDPDTTVQVIRKELTPDEITPKNLRTNPETGVLQQTPDGGTTWTDVPGLDPRSNPAGLLPPLTTSDPACDAAAGMVQAVRDVVAQLNAGGNAWTATSLIIALVGIFLFPLGWVIDAILVVCEAIFVIGLESVNMAMTETVYGQLLCIFRDRLDASGQLSAENFAGLYTDVEAQLEETAANVSERIFDILGFVGLSNAGVYYGLTGDCGDCACDHDCTSYNWTTQGEPPNWALFNGTSADGRIYQSCQGARSGYNFAVWFGNGTPFRVTSVGVVQTVINQATDAYVYGITTPYGDPLSGQVLLLHDAACTGDFSGDSPDLTTQFYGFQFITDTATGCGNSDAQFFEVDFCSPDLAAAGLC